jgi:cell division protein FtsQ
MQPAAPPAVRVLPGRPLEITEPEGDAPFSSGNFRPGSRRRPWWRPASTLGRVLLLSATLALLAGFTVSAYLLKTYLDRDSRFRIHGASDIDATGLAEVSRDQMLPVFGEDIGRNIFFVPLSARRRQLEQIPWIEHATVMRLLPDRIRVAVVERQPVAFVRQGQEIGLIDAQGVLLEMPAAAMAKQHYSFPVVTGIHAGQPQAARAQRMAVYQRLLSELDSSGQKLSSQISEIDLTDPEDARVLMPEQGGDILAHFGQDHFLERYQRYQNHIAAWRLQYPKLAAVDLRYEQQVVLAMQPGADNSSGSATPQNAPASGGSSPATSPKPKQQVEVAGVPAKGNVPAAHAQPKAKAGSITAKAARDKAAKARLAKLKAKNRKRAEAKRAALNRGRQRTAPSTHQVLYAAGGQ